jgi:mannose PTS system EIIA component
MTEILLVSHGNLAKEFVQIAEMIIERPVNATPVCLDIQLNQEACTDIINNAIGALPIDKKIVILTDLFGGTPSNISIPMIQKDRIEVITGVNLPMLLYLLTQPEDKEFQELCEGAKKAGEEAILIAGDFLS